MKRLEYRRKGKSCCPSRCKSQIGGEGRFLEQLDGLLTVASLPTSPNSPREEMPFEVTPLVPCLTRCVETSATAADHEAAVALK
jgi:hypothetical protein